VGMLGATASTMPHVFFRAFLAGARVDRGDAHDDRDAQSCSSARLDVSRARCRGGSRP
jgi:hypothetical protein